MQEKYYDEALAAYGLNRGACGFKKYGDGHINDTYLCDARHGRVALQRINSRVFKNPYHVMENALGVTEHIISAIKRNGGDPDREALQFLRTLDDRCCFTDSQGDVWRATRFFEDAITYSRAEDVLMLESAACAFARFMLRLSDYPAQTLHVTIPDFHDTRKRFGHFMEALGQDVKNRAADVRDEISFVLSRKDEMGTLVDMLSRGELPLRVTHNDTKLNNVLFSTATREAICAIDLDTVMPGLSAYDFGDAIRSCANRVDEDKAKRGDFAFENFAAYARGYIKTCGSVLTQNEFDVLALSALIITLELGMRFLTDYLNGDVYFAVEHETQNLQRAISHFNIVADMEERRSDMEKLIRGLSRNI